MRPGGAPGVGWSLAGFLVSGADVAWRGVPDSRLGHGAVSRLHRLGAVQDAVGQAVEDPGVLETVPAGGAGPIGAVGARLGKVALVVGSLVQGGVDRADVGAGDDDGVRARFQAGNYGLGIRQRRGVTAGAGRDIVGAVI